MIDLFGNKIKVKKPKKKKVKTLQVNSENLVTANGLSGGKSSSYIACHYPADYDIFALCCIDDPNANRGKSAIDKKIMQMVNDKLQKYCSDQKEFVATSEDPIILKLMFDLEQHIGREITWLRGLGWEDMLRIKKAIPNMDKRFCTTIMKMIPTYNFIFKYTPMPVKMRIGFRYDEKERKDNFNEFYKMPTRCDIFSSREEIIEKTKNHIIARSASERVNFGNYYYHVHENIHWRVGDFPLIDDKVTHFRVQKYFEDKPLVFPPDSNCQNCFWKDEQQLRKNFETNPSIMNWAAVHEAIMDNTFKEDNSLLDIRKMGIQEDFFFGTGSGCQSGGFCTS